MFCPECGSEYRDDFTKCSDCDVALVDELPLEHEPLSSGLVPLTVEHSFELVGELLDRLEKASVPYVIEAGTALSLLDRTDEALDEPQDWQARIYVASALLQRAARILVELREEIRAQQSQ